MTEPRIALQLYTLRDYLQTPADMGTTLQRVGEIGYEHVQLSGLGPVDPAELKTMLDNAGLGVCATHVSLERLQTSLDEIIEEHRLWSCANVAIGGVPEEYRSPEGYARFAKEGSEIGRKLADAGLTFSYHNHYWELERAGGRRGLDMIYEESDARFLLAELDTYWLAYTGADPTMWIRQLKGREPVCHFKDMAIRGDKQIMIEIGDGNLNWPAIIAACRECGVEWCVVEQDVCEIDPFESVAISYANLRAMGLA